jgi:hypothetical protein
MTSVTGTARYAKPEEGENLVKTWVKVTVVTVIVGVAAKALGPILWPIAEGGAQPTAGQLFFFIVLEAIQSLAFGLGVSFMVFGLPTVRRVSPNSQLMA